MEIREYLEIVRRRLWIPVALPLCAALIVVATTLLGPQQHAATATVAAGAFTSGSGSASPYTGPNADRAFVEDVLAVLETRAAAVHIAEASEVPPSAVVQGLHASPVGDGGLVQVVYTTAQPAEAEQVARQAVRGAITLLFQPSRELAQARIDGARRAIAAVDAEIDRFVAQTGLVLPDVVYERGAERLADLQAQQAQNEAPGQGPPTRIKAAMDAQRAELARLAPQVRAFTAMQDRRDEAVERLGDATGAVAQLDALLQALDSGRIVTVGAPVPIAQAPIALRKGAAAAGAGLFLGVALVVLLESVARRRPAANTTRQATGRSRPSPRPRNNRPSTPTRAGQRGASARVPVRRSGR
ncbi:MAG: hypothetical protein ACRD0K_17880 [Egibacteraceae bacterium]